ncbi:carboxymuconolactone decarboxylase family protein [Cryptosporangium phraense]|uniref:Carboxymuconolactone decarboxylase family protein n=1 Tax=Cryptosporangium phraense TaxID=2593070 RepID=A0A545AQ06_9ACTN|nr:carboxymuconolactone decarboxylase family protein [Cryptosporangium phraense]TQS43341.1 carboxymuconolactone decarboxylase family protein [Cryptosporangium phraense]
MSTLTPVPREDWSPDLTEFIASFRANVGAGRSEAGRASGANLLGTLAHHPALTQAFLTFNGHVLYGTTLTPRQRELLVLRVAHRRRSDYEWAQHVLLGRAAGLTDDEIAAVASDPVSLGALDRVLLVAADELLVEGALSGETWKALSADLDDRQIMDVVFTVGTYALVAMALRSFGVEPEPELVPHLPS